MKALRQPHVRGHWGEVQLRQVVELAGMVEHTDFVEQETFTVDDGAMRPDLMVRLPGGKRVIVDAKTPLAAYFDAIESQDEAERLRSLADHARQVRDHLTRLGSKAYWSQFDDTPEFVVMFLPGEALFSAALTQDPCSSSTASPTASSWPARRRSSRCSKAVSYGWRQERIQANAQEICELGAQLYHRLLVLATHYDDVKRGLDRAVDAYNRSVASLETRVLVTARRFRDLGASSGDDIPEVETIEKTTREVQAPEIRGLFDEELDGRKPQHNAMVRDPRPPRRCRHRHRRCDASAVRARTPAGHVGVVALSRRMASGLSRCGTAASCARARRRRFTGTR